MNQDETHGTAAPAKAGDENWGGLKRVSSRRDGMFVALWGLVMADYVVLMLRIGSKHWIETYGLAVIAVMLVLAILLNFGLARVRTVRPRHFRLAEGIALLWGAVGASITFQHFNVGQGETAPIGVTLLAALVLSGPMLACALWLMVRGR